MYNIVILVQVYIYIYINNIYIINLKNIKKIVQNSFSVWFSVRDRSNRGLV